MSAETLIDNEGWYQRSVECLNHYFGVRAF